MAAPVVHAISNIAMAINYGYNKVRFITPVKVGAKVRARAEIAKVDQLDGAVQATLTTTVEIEGSDKPAAVAESRATRVHGKYLLHLCDARSGGDHA